MHRQRDATPLDRDSAAREEAAAPSNREEGSLLAARPPIPEGSSPLGAWGERAAEAPLGTEDDASRLGGGCPNDHLDGAIRPPPAGLSSNVFEHRHRRIDDLDPERELAVVAVRD
jgi:hypothetical protein